MKLLLIISSFIVVQAGVVQEDCDGVVIDGIYYEREVLKSNLDKPYLLAGDVQSNTIYFSYSTDPKDESFKSAKINVNTKEFEDIKGVTNGFAQAVDPKTHDVFIGGSDGIYKYDSKTNKAEFYGAKDANIWSLFAKDIVYYSEFPAQFLYTLSNGQSMRFKDLEETKVDSFVIDNDDDMFFTNATGLYSQKKGTKNAVLYKEFIDTGVRGLTVDYFGRVYTCFKDGVYTVRKTTKDLEKLFEIDNGYGVAFDSDNNIIYADSTSLVRLKVNKEKNC